MPWSETRLATQDRRSASISSRHAMSGSPAALLPNDFDVAPTCSFPCHPSRRQLERPPVSGELRLVAPHWRRQTPCSSIG
jgi:hypothetical protein